MMKISKIIFCILPLFILSCEYEPDGSNFKDLEPPDETATVYVTLNDFYPGETVYLFNNAALRLSADIFGERINYLTITIDDNEPFEIFYLPYDFGFKTADFNIGETHTFTINGYIGSGSQSLADLMGYEGYVGELTWEIYMAGDPEKFRFDYRKNDDGFLELFWDTTEFPESMIDKFVIQRSFEKIEIPASQRTFVDYDYCMGWDSRTIYVYLKGYDEYVFAKWLDLKTPEIKMQFEDIDLENLRIYWKKPFANALFELRNYDNEIIYLTQSKDTSIVLPQAALSECVSFYLYVIPEHASHSNQHQIYGSHCMGTKLNFAYLGRMAYSKAQNLFFASDYNSSIISLDNDFNILSQIHIEDLVNNETIIACAPNSKKIAVQCNNITKVYADNNFVNPVTINTGINRTFWITDNDKLLTIDYYNHKCDIYNTVTGNKTGSIEFSYYPSYHDFYRCSSISNDGKYVSFCSTQGIEIFEINESEIRLIYTDNGRYTATMFHPLQSNTMVVKKGNYIETWDIPSCNVKQSTQMDYAVLYNIDPITGNLLYYEDGALKISKLDSPSQPLFNISHPGAGYNQVELINQIILAGDNYIFNTQHYVTR